MRCCGSYRYQRNGNSWSESFFFFYDCLVALPLVQYVGSACVGSRLHICHLGIFYTLVTNIFRHVLLILTRTMNSLSLHAKTDSRLYNIVVVTLEIYGLVDRMGIVPHSMHILSHPFCSYWLSCDKTVTFTTFLPPRPLPPLSTWHVPLRPYVTCHIPLPLPSRTWLIPIRFRAFLFYLCSPLYFLSNWWNSIKKEKVEFIV